MWFIYVGVLCLLSVWYYIRTYRVWSRRGVKQTIPWPFFGDSGITVFQLMSVPEILNKIYYMYPKTRYTGFYQFQEALLLLKDPELIKQITIKDFDHFTDHRTVGTSDEIDPLFNKNLFFLKGQTWKDMRSLLSGSFTSSKMKIMYNLIVEASENFVDYFCSKNEDLVEVEFKDIFSKYTNDVIASTSFGIKVDSLREPKNEFYAMGKKMTNFNTFRGLIGVLLYMAVPTIAKLLKIKILAKDASDFFINIIDQAIRMREENHVVRKDMINIMLEEREGKARQDDEEVIDSGFAVVEESQNITKHPKKQMNLTNLDITAHAMIFFLAGFDTVSTAICNCCYELAINPDIQDKLRNEIKKTMKEHNEKLTYESTLRMKYLDMVITETLRKYPGLSATERVCVKPYTIEPVYPDEQPVHLNVGDIVFLPPYSLHHDPKYFADPEKFIPERFSDDNKTLINKYTYMPFGIGPRACIGSRFALLEMKTLLIQLVNKFEIVPVRKTKIPMELCRSTMSVMSKDGYYAAFKLLK
ncbi:cytochrome P450 9e2-like isoform X2 [Rhynchophorus ferrugineus]